MFTNQSKGSTSYLKQSKKILSFIVTDDLSKILVGEDEDLYLVWQTPTTFVDSSKGSTTFTNLTKS